MIREGFMMSILMIGMGLIASVPFARATATVFDPGVDYRVVLDRSGRTVICLKRQGPFTLLKEVTGPDFTIRTQADSYPISPPEGCLYGVVLTMENGKEVILIKRHRYRERGNRCP